MTPMTGRQVVGAQPAPSSTAGAAVYRDHCAGCHDGADWRAPTIDSLRLRSPQAIVDALASGSMRYQGLSLSGGERRSVAEFVTGRPLRGPAMDGAIGRCRNLPAIPDPLASPSWNGWSPALDNTHFQPESQAGLSAAAIPKLKLKWAFGFPDASSAWAQPTIAGGRIFIGSQNGTVFSLDARSGCIAWTFTARSGVRGSVTIGRVMSAGDRRGGSAAFVADQAGYVYALNPTSGALLWSRRVEDHPLVRLTGSPVYSAGRLYVPTSSYEEGGKPPGYGCCTFRGSLIALEASTGEMVWQAFTIPQPPRLIRSYADGTELHGPSGGAIWSAPTLDTTRNAIYVGVGNTYSGAPQKTTDAILAFDLRTGAIRWTAQMPPGEHDVFGCAPGDVNCGDRPGPDFDFGASPMLATAADGRQFIVAGQKSGVVYALDPDHRGRTVWRYRAGGGSGLGGIQWGIATDGGPFTCRWPTFTPSGRADCMRSASRLGNGPGTRRRPTRSRVESRAARAAAHSSRRLPPFPARCSPRRTTGPFARTPPRAVRSSGRSTRTAPSRRSTASRRAEGR